MPAIAGAITILLHKLLSAYLGNCEAGVVLTIRVLFFLILITAVVLFLKIHQWQTRASHHSFKSSYLIFSFIIYTFLNGFIFFIRTEPETSCSLDRQTTLYSYLYFYISGFFASIFILVLGFLIDGSRYIFFEEDRP
ncbi:MAG: hypothetical protein M3142_02795 [Bacteroidota bacterium]|nr:hypothetical protein [Bacteroidota bacterium]